MTVYVDNANIKATVKHKGKNLTSVWCHLTADTTEELDAFAVSIGLKTQWRQATGTWKEHYDLTSTRKVKAIKAGAIEVTWREHVQLLKIKQLNS